MTFCRLCFPLSDGPFSLFCFSLFRLSCLFSRFLSLSELVPIIIFDDPIIHGLFIDVGKVMIPGAWVAFSYASTTRNLAILSEQTSKTY